MQSLILVAVINRKCLYRLIKDHWCLQCNLKEDTVSSSYLGKVAAMPMQVP